MLINLHVLFGDESGVAASTVSIQKDVRGRETYQEAIGDDSKEAMEFLAENLGVTIEDFVINYNEPEKIEIEAIENSANLETLYR